MVTLFARGATVERREVLHGRLWLSFPVRVVDDDGDVLAVRLDPGAPFELPEHPFGVHPWARHASWGGTVVLQLYKSGELYSVWKIFEADGTFRHWYLNFEAPVVRGKAHFDTDDYGLDLVVAPSGERRWKDVTDLHHQRVEGRISERTVVDVLAAAASAEHLLETDQRWWSRWDDWIPASCEGSRSAQA